MTTDDKNKTTKQKILDVANDLFAKNGFSGTSIREIATGADVNLAAINYHFKNKENLYWKVFEENYETIRIGIEKCGEKTQTTADFAIAVFNFFTSKEAALMNTFKIFLTDSVATPEEGFSFEKNHNFGPPGEEAFLEKIRNDLGDGYPMESYQWAIKMIFSTLVHFGVMMSTTIMKRKCLEDPMFSPENLEKAFRHSVHAHLDYLKVHKSL